MNPMRIAFIIPTAFALMLGGCGTFGSGKNQPDEFKVLTMAPLVVPPEYNLLPPRPGELGIEDLRASEAARQAILGTARSNSKASAGERALVQSSTRGVVDSSIRTKLDAESGNLTVKSKSFADRILFWRDGDTYIGDETLLDADAEAERLRREKLVKGAIGNGKVKISKGSKIRLPGL
jgi:Protein of unknown function (DUF3035)